MQKNLALMLLVTCAALRAQSVIAEAGFEDNTTQGWISRGDGVALSVTDEAAASGSKSLKTTGRTQGFHGPSLRLDGKLVKGATYSISAAVRLVAGQSASSIKITMQRNVIGEAAARFDQIAASSADVTDGDWVTLQGQYTFPTEVSGLLLYIESANPSASYLIDDFRIQLLTAPPPQTPQDNSGISTSFESNDLEGWRPRIGNETVEVTTADRHAGQYSLRVSGRQRIFEGTKINATGKLYNGSQYQVSMWVKLAPGDVRATLRLSLERTLQGVTTFHTVVPNTVVTDGAWVRMSATYSMALAYDSIWLYVETADSNASFFVDDFEVTYVPPFEIQQDIPSVAETWSEYFPIGAAISSVALAGPHLQLLKKHFNSITADNDMKWTSLHPNEATFNFANADRLANFARQNKTRMRGHTLLWHEQVPAWLFRDKDGKDLAPNEESKQLVLERLRTHIREVVGRYKDVIYAWDVVNEAIDPSRADCMRRTPWFSLTGKDFIDVAFETAREVAPEAKLFYNDYDTTNTSRRTCMLNLVRDLKSRGIPIDGMGHQMHVNIDYPSAESITNTINLFADLGVDNEITELDMSVYNNSTAIYTAVPAAVIARQGARYRDIFEAMRNLKGKITNVTFWGMADDNTWLKTFPITRLDLPLLFDEQLQAKPAYWGVVDPSRLP